MNGDTLGGMSWTTRFLLGLLLLLIGAAASVWALAHYQGAARFLGVAPAAAPAPQQRTFQVVAAPPPTASGPQAASDNPNVEAQIVGLQQRVQQVENESQQAQGSAGRADALLIAFAARRAIERGVPLGYLEPLLVDRFGPNHPQAIATIVTASRTPVRLSDLIAQYQDLEPDLVGGAPDKGLWASISNGFGSLISIHRANRPSTQPEARYQRALSYLMGGEVDSALAETMRLPGATRASSWIGKARQYVAVHRSLDEIETAALIGKPQQQ